MVIDEARGEKMKRERWWKREGQQSVDCDSGQEKATDPQEHDLGEGTALGKKREEKIKGDDEVSRLLLTDKDTRR